MATNCEALSESGLLYRKVQVNLVRVVERLKASPDAAETLKRHFKQQDWIGPADKSSLDELMDLVLDRIKTESRTNYDAFMTMLDSVHGLKDIKDKIDKTIGKWSLFLHAHRGTVDHDAPPNSLYRTAGGAPVTASNYHGSK